MKCQDIILCGLTAAGADGRGGNTAGRTKFTLKSHRSVNNLLRGSVKMWADFTYAER
jgi:hypothetical protein